MPSPVMTAMETGRIARVEEITRCLPEVQDALVPVLSERRIAVPELGEHSVAAIEGFGVIATANLRDRSSIRIRRSSSPVATDSRSSTMAR